MPEIVLFAEDFGQETFLDTLLRRLASDHGVRVEIRPRSTRGGLGQMKSELRQFLRDLKAQRAHLPDLLLVARDANCSGFQACRRGLEAIVPEELRDLIVYAIPDPHIERWLLLDSAAFKAAVGKGCAAPDHKCEKHRYKQLLRQAVRDAGTEPLLGGLEHTESIVQELDLSRLEMLDRPFKELLAELRRWFKRWQVAGGSSS